MQRLKNGFTFIELSLSILFLSVLSITVALIIANIISIYNKGLAIKSVNSVGNNLIEEFFTGINSSPATELTAICDTNFNYSYNPNSAYRKCLNDHANYFIFSDRSSYVRNTDSSESKLVQISGVFCTGKYSYIWNTGYVNNSIYRNSATNELVSPINVIYNVSDGSGGSIRRETKTSENADFRLLRFEDPSRVACASQLDGYGSTSSLDTNTYNYTAKSTYDLTHDATGTEYRIATEPDELIHENDNSLAIYELFIARPSQDSTTNRLFYAGSFILATLRGGVDITATGDYCQISGGNEEFNSCAINKFNFAAQATGK